MQKHCTKYNDNYSIVYWYDNSGNVVGFFYTDKTAAAPVTKAYIYTKNTLGDVTGIVDSTGNIVAKYVYDPWGMVIAVTDGNGNDVSATANHIANINPIRYRGYYLDSETGFYYLQSRYYFPLWKRFINADDSQFIGTTGTAIGVNAFAYCENSPITHTDDTGYLRIPRWVVSAAIDSIIWAFLQSLGVTFSCLTQPVKALARKAGKALLKRKIHGMIKGVMKTLINSIYLISRKLIPVIRKAFGWLLKKWTKSLSAIKLTKTIMGAVLSATTNSMLNLIVSNITIFLSIGGLVAGLWDKRSDNKLNGWIVLW